MGDLGTQLAAASRVGPVAGGRAEHVRGVDTSEEQLRRMESRLLAEVNGDSAAEREVRRHLDAARARFATARVRTFLPILIEREVRRQMTGH